MIWATVTGRCAVCLSTRGELLNDRRSREKVYFRDLTLSTEVAVIELSFIDVETTPRIPSFSFVHPAQNVLLLRRYRFTLNMTDWKSPGVITAEYSVSLRLLKFYLIIFALQLRSPSFTT